MNQPRRLPVGAEPRPGGVDFRVWAPKRRRVEVLIEDGGTREGFDLKEEGGGYFSGTVSAARAGSLYRFRLDGGDSYLYPDPASRFQPEGPHGPSQVVDPARFDWTDAGWRGRSLAGQVIYEMHVGTFTREGTWAAAARELPALADLGVTVVEMMPVSDFTGRFGWGYDGVNLFAPTRLYGTPDDLRRFVDEAHRHGLAVILDVVYNHFGPDGNYLDQFSDDYTTDRYPNEWGEAINFDGPRSAPVREYFVMNAGYWVEEFHFDGLRLDATQQIFDSSRTHVLVEIGRRVREAARGRATVVVSENEPQQTHLVRPVERGGYGLDGLWNDDFHHTAVVALTGRNEAYYTDHSGTPQEFVSAMKYGYLYQGQHYRWQGKRRGTPAFDLPPEAFINFIENHDQVANSARGERLHRLTSPARLRAMTALLLLGPATPMLFQGQEFASSAPFLFFADHEPELAAKVASGRAEFLSQLPSVHTPEVRARLAAPHDGETFERCKLDHSERGSESDTARGSEGDTGRSFHRQVYELHRDLLRLRREDSVFSARRRVRLDGAVLGPDAFVLRFFADDGRDRLLVVNFGRDLRLAVVPEPLLAPPAGTLWRVLWSSESVAYGGHGTPPLESEDGWIVRGDAAVALAPRPAEDGPDPASLPSGGSDSWLQRLERALEGAGAGATPGDAEKATEKTEGARETERNADG
ncbi:MAG TPA: malto-oligosyltrehalose trehalohydrolase [Pyrinomonadaceae bacterium]|nr:malto-oligosyltrehalose trehalohydrolase [Pyrinomonadaceae bacterium]